MSIPVENIYFLLGYAWNRLDEKDRVDVSIDETTQLVDIFAKILINATKVLLKRGIDRSYVDYTGEINGIRGKLELSQTIKSNLLEKQKTICSYDEFSFDILPNRILSSTVYTLCHTTTLDKELRDELYAMSRMLSGITPVSITSSLFRQVRINRNNRIYGFIMDVCKIIHESILPSETKGYYRFIDFYRDEAKMAQLFESFVFNFYKIEQTAFNIRRESIRWNFEEGVSEYFDYLPLMKTDITLENDARKIIIDAKFYKETMKSHFNKERVNSGNLYQLFSYLVNQEEATDKSVNATGILLYPTVQQEYDLEYQYKDHPIHIRTINLNMNWRDISKRLHDIIA